MGKYVILEIMIAVINMGFVCALLYRNEQTSKSNCEECPWKKAEKLYDKKKDTLPIPEEKNSAADVLIEKSKPDIAIAGKLTVEEIEDLKKRARKIFPKKVEKYAKLMNVTYGRITIRNQHTLWGSCSDKGNLNFNCLLLLCPEEVLDSVVVHELAHRIEFNHSARFYEVVERYIPDYKVRAQWLKEHGNEIMKKNI